MLLPAVVICAPIFRVTNSVIDNHNHLNTSFNVSVDDSIADSQNDPKKNSQIKEGEKDEPKSTKVKKSTQTGNHLNRYESIKRGRKVLEYKYKLYA